MSPIRSKIALTQHSVRSGLVPWTSRRQCRKSVGSPGGGVVVEGRVSHTEHTSWRVSELRGATARRAARSCPLSWWKAPSQLCAQEKSKDVLSRRMEWLARAAACDSELWAEPAVASAVASTSAASRAAAAAGVSASLDGLTSFPTGASGASLLASELR